MGVFFAIAQKNEDKEKARKMIKNYVIGLVVIFAILVACPYLVILLNREKIELHTHGNFNRFEIQQPCSDEDDPKDKVRNKLKHYNLMLSYCNSNGEQYQKLKKEKEEWLKSLHLDENRIIDITHKYCRVSCYAETILFMPEFLKFMGNVK